MPKTVEITTYSFDELDDAAKEKAREWFREGMYECDQLSELLEQDLGYYGFDGFKCYFSLNYCQGDGVDFEGVVDIGEIMKAGDEGNISTLKDASEYQELCDAIRKAEAHEFEISAEIKHEGHYHHYNSMRVEVELHGEVRFTNEHLALQDELQRTLSQYASWVSKQLEKLGYEDIEYQNSDEVVDENIRINEYAFTKSGSRTTIL